MIIEASELSVRIDTGANAPGSILERFEGDTWQPYLVEGKSLTWPVKIDTLPPDEYRAVNKR